MAALLKVGPFFYTKRRPGTALGALLQVLIINVRAASAAEEVPLAARNEMLPKPRITIYPPLASPAPLCHLISDHLFL